MSVSYISQKIKSKTLETTTEAIIENEKLEILTDNQLGIKEIKFINDGTVINTITNSIELSEYENRIFDAVIQSGIVENLVQLINSLKLQSKVDSADNLSNIQAVLTTLDETRVLKISLFIENDESRNIQVSFNDSQWNIEINQDDKNLVKYARILKDKLSAIPEKVFSIIFEQLLLVSELGKPITETPLKDMIESYIEYPNFPSLTPDDDEYREWRYDYDRPSQWPKERKYLHEKKQNELFFKIRNSKCEKSQYGWYVHKYYYPLKDNPAYYDYNLRAKWVEKYSDNPDEYIVGDDEICDHLQFQEKEFVDNFQQIKFDYLNEGKNIFNHQNKTLNGDFDSQKIIFILSLVFKLSTLQNKQKINCVRHHLFVSLSTLRTERFRSFYKSDYLEKIDISFITEINSKKIY